MLRKLLELIFFLGTLGGLGYYVLCLWSALRSRPAPKATPITVVPSLSPSLAGVAAAGVF